MANRRRSTTSINRRRPQPQRVRGTSQRNVHAGGDTFRNAFCTEATVNTTVLSLTFDVPITVTTLPTGIRTDVPDVDPVSIVQTGEKSCEITFDGSVSTAQQVIFPNNDPAIRTRNGGWAVSNVFLVIAI